MTQPNKTLILRGVFAVAVVAVTAGAAGLAQATPSSWFKPAPAHNTGNGYGTGIDQLLAALDQFNRAYRAATEQFHQDVNACVSETRRQPGHPASFDAASRTYWAQVDASLGKFHGEVANHSAINTTSDKFDRHFADARDRSNREFDDAQSRFANNHVAPGSRNNVNKCINKARNKYQDAIEAARKQLHDAIRSILH